MFILFSFDIILVRVLVSTGNKLFGRQWKYHEESIDIDLDTLPQTRCARQVGKGIEVMALDEIFKKILTGSENATVTYCDDGSKKQGTGSFIVQGVHILNMPTSIRKPSPCRCPPHWPGSL